MAKQTHQQSAQSAAHTVDGDSPHRVVDLGHFIEELNGHDHDNAADSANEEGAHGIYRVASGGNAHQAGQGRVVGHGDVGLLVTDPGENQSGAAGHGGDMLVLKNTRPARSISSSVSMPTVEAPLKPNQQNHRMNTPKAAEVILAQNSPGLAVLVILANAGPQDFGADQSAQAAHHVHRGGTGEIVEASCESQPPPQIQWPEMGR